MRIAESLINLESSHQVIERHHRRESLVYWQQGRQPVSAENETPGKDAPVGPVAGQVSLETVKLSQAARRAAQVQNKAEKFAEDDKVLDSLNMRILRAMFEKLIGKRMKLVDVDALRKELESAQQGQTSQQVSEPSQQLQGWGLAYDSFASHYESETTSFSAEGVIRTEDGREIDIAVELNMSREFYSEQQLSIRAGDALKDPLVINFDGKAAELTKTTFSFDIDVDGEDDQISFLEHGSGFLALDKNLDNVINDGSELFGALTGDGFKELANHDLDENGWIDENDAIYNRLRIWTQDENGDDRLLALGQQGIGALYLGRVDTPFAIKDSANSLQGQIRASGVFLHEDGRAGTLQQLDLVA